jgi:hypothetical protein
LTGEVWAVWAWALSGGAAILTPVSLEMVYLMRQLYAVPLLLPQTVTKPLPFLKISQKTLRKLYKEVYYGFADLRYVNPVINLLAGNPAGKVSTLVFCFAFQTLQLHFRWGSRMVLAGQKQHMFVLFGKFCHCALRAQYCFRKLQHGPPTGQTQ